MIDSKLLAICPSSRIIFKYYQKGEHRNLYMPDILDYLDGKLEVLDCRYNENKYFADRDFLLDMIDEDIDRIEKIIDRLNTENYRYYFVHDLDITPVPIGEFPVKTPKAVNDEITLIDTGHTVQAYYYTSDEITWCAPASDADAHMPDGTEIYFCNSNCDEYYNAELSDVQYCVGFEGIQDRCSGLVFRQCKDCGKIFTLTSRRCEWFTNHNLELPKRCPACIERKHRREEG